MVKLGYRESEERGGGDEIRLTLTETNISIASLPRVDFFHARSLELAGCLTHFQLYCASSSDPYSIISEIDYASIIRRTKGGNQPS